jgi:hypothetical protein
MRRKKKPSVNDVIHRYSRKANKTKLTVRKLSRDCVLIEGNSDSLKFLAHILLALTDEEDCGFQISPKSAGKAWFAKDAQLGIYLHRLPCVGKRPPQGQGIYKRPLRGKS